MMCLPVWHLTWSPAQSAHRESRAIWTHNVGSDEEEAWRQHQSCPHTQVPSWLHIHAPHDADLNARLALVHSSSVIKSLLSRCVKSLAVRWVVI